jgi:hypothetical protein
MLSMVLPTLCCFMVFPALEPPYRIVYYSGFPVPANTMLTWMLATSALSLIVRVCSTTLQRRDESSSSSSGAAGSATQHIEQRCRATTSKSVGALTQCLVSTAFAHVLIDTVVCSFSAQIGSMLYHRDHHVVISRGGVTEAVQKEPPPCRRYSQGHQVAKTLCTILRRGKREALFNVCRKYTNSRSEASLIPHKFTAYCIL